MEASSRVLTRRAGKSPGTRPASSEITSDEEAIDALLARLDELVTFDQAREIGSLLEVTEQNGQCGARRTDCWRFHLPPRTEWPDGPIHRIVRLARGGTDPAEDINDADLHLTENDLG